MIERTPHRPLSAPHAEAVHHESGADPDGMTAEGAESVFYPPDRATMQRFSQARELLEEKRYGEAVRLLGDILELPEDGFFQPDRDSPVYRSLKGEARRLIGEMPAEGKASYELQYGAQAQQIFDMFRNNPAAQAQLRAPIYEDKVVELIFEKAKVTDKKVSKKEILAEDDLPEGY